MSDETLKQLDSAEAALDKKRKQFDAMTSALLKRTKKDIAAVDTVLIPQSKAAAAATDRNVAAIHALASKHAEKHAALVESKVPWDKMAASIRRAADQHAQDALNTLSQLSQ